MTSKKKANNKVVSEPVSPKEPLLSAWSFLSLFCLAGMTVQFFFTMKIVLVDKEIATLALSLVFFFVFVVGYFAFLRPAKMTKLLLIVSGSVILLLSLTLTIVYLCLGEKPSNVVFYGLAAMFVSSAFPWSAYLLTLSTRLCRNGLPNSRPKDGKKS